MLGRLRAYPDGRVRTARSNGEGGDEELDEWTDAGCVDKRSDADVTAKPPSDGEHPYFDGGAGRANRETPGRQAGHEPISRAGTEASPDVEPGGQGVEKNAARQEANPGSEGIEVGQHRQCGLGGETDYDRIRHGPKPRPLPERDPENEDNKARQDHDRSEGDAGLSGNSLVEDIPRINAKLGRKHQCDADAEEEQPGEEVEQSNDDSLPVDPLK